MRRMIASFAFVLAGLALVAQASALDMTTLLQNREGPDKFRIIHTADLAKLMADPKSGVWIGDANHPSTREQFGVIPGAHLLSSDDKYDVNTELPRDKNAKLVFYCADYKCVASHEAARRAIDAGYTDVSVMGDGIVGWFALHQPVQKIGDSRSVGGSV